MAGGLVQLSEGDFTISDSIEIPSGCGLRGVGFSSRIVLGDNKDVDLIVAQGSPTGWAIEDLVLDGNKTQQASGSGINLVDMDQGLLRNVTIQNCKEHGIEQVSLGAGGERLRIIACIVDGCDERGIYLATPIDNSVLLLGNEIVNNGSHGLDLVGALDVIAQANNFNNNGGSGILLNGAVQLVICNNICRDNTRYGIEEATLAIGACVSDNYLFGNGLGGHLRVGTENTVRDNAGQTQYEQTGFAVIDHPNTSLTVNHGLPSAPGEDEIVLTPTNDMGNATKYWADTRTATQFDINIDVAPGVANTARFAWWAVQWKG